ncbi:retrotransposon protein, putative, ty1-copia subclass [Tanacetum coccineum]
MLLLNLSSSLLLGLKDHGVLLDYMLMYHAAAGSFLTRPTRDFHACVKQEEGQSVSSTLEGQEGTGPQYLAVLPKKKKNSASEAVVGSAKLDLDSALCLALSFGHISKKRIEKLQHDGLLNSTDLRAFEKCVPCMSGKMARKPYTHQDHGIIAHRTPPYTPQHNGVSERRNRTLLDMVRSMMSQTTLPKSFGVYALEMLQAFSNMDQDAIVGVLEDLEIIQEEDTYPSIDTSLNHEEDDQEIDEPQSDIIPIRRSTRTRRALESYECGNAIHERQRCVASLLNFILMARPLVARWLFSEIRLTWMEMYTPIKLVLAKGYTQTPGIDYEETFSPVADIRAIRILIAIAAYYDYEIWQMDVKTAFLNGYLNEEVYMEQPEGFVNQKYPNRVCKLKRSIYGLKQASRQWNKRFDDEIKKFGFSQNADEPCVYLKAKLEPSKHSSHQLTQKVVVRYIPMLQDVKSTLESVLLMKDLGDSCKYSWNQDIQEIDQTVDWLMSKCLYEIILKRFAHGEFPKTWEYPHAG